MSLKVVTILLLLIISGNCTHSYANLVYSKIEPSTNNTLPPPAKKKKAKRQKKHQKSRSILHFKHNKALFKTKTILGQDATHNGLAVGIFAFLLILLIPLALFIVGGLTGGVGWFIAGSILAFIWVVTGYIFGFASYGAGIGAGITLLLSLSILVTTLLSFLGLFIWALAANLSLLLILSIIWGGLALLGIISTFVFLAIMTS